MKWLVLVGVLVLALAACGGDGNEDGDGQSDRILRLSSGDISESDYRLQVRVALTQASGEAFCRSLEGLSDEETLDLAVAVQKQAGYPTPIRESDPADRIRAVSIVKEECDRIY